jgi:hypothetical protein
VRGPEKDVDKLLAGYGMKRAYDAEGLPMILFENEWALERAATREKSLVFEDVQPRAVGRQAASPQGAQVGASGET